MIRRFAWLMPSTNTTTHDPEITPLYENLDLNALVSIAIVQSTGRPTPIRNVLLGRPVKEIEHNFVTAFALKSRMDNPPDSRFDASQRLGETICSFAARHARSTFYRQSQKDVDRPTIEVILRQLNNTFDSEKFPQNRIEAFLPINRKTHFALQ
jgi:hypothetical protein